MSLENRLYNSRRRQLRVGIQ